MTHKEEQFFDALVKDREENAKTLEKPSMRGIKRTVVEKYSDQAHFIYELLQNADDAGATRVTFLLSCDKLLFKHNGTRKFSISNPANEEIDEKNGTLGDINAITSVGNSNKTGATIGKFGVGFKAVFQYTSSPAIFEKHVSFRIKNFISLEPLNFDHPERKRGETLFEFPFDKEDCPPARAFEDISAKLSMLDCPILFLSHLQKVKFQLGDKVGTYEKETKSSQMFGDISAELLSLIKIFDRKREKRNLWLFSRKDSGRNYSVGYFLDDKNHLYPVDKPAFCFFPTKRSTKLKFIIHAPFLLTDSREGILAGNDHNLKMIKLLGTLAADSLICLRDLGFIDNNILKIIPVRESDFANADEISFKPVFKAIKEKMLTAEILPTRDNYVSAENAYWAVAPHLIEILSDEQLGALVYNSNAKWIFTRINRSTVDLDIRDYFIDIKSFTEDKMFDKVDENFIEAQSLEWFHRFYKWLSERSTKRIQDAKNKPFFLDVNYKATAAIDSEGKPLIFMPTTNNIGNYPTICSELLQNPETKKFLMKSIEIKEPSKKDKVTNKILPLYENNSVTEMNEADCFKIIFAYYRECHNDKIDAYLDELKKVIYLRSLDRNFVKPYDSVYRYGFERLYMPETEFIGYFTRKTPECFLDKNFYLDLVGTDEENRLVEFLKKLGVAEEIRYLCNKIIPLYKSNLMTDDENHFKIIFHYYQKLSSWEKDNYVKNLKKNIRLRRRDKKFVEPKDLYLPLPEIIEYFNAANRAPLIDKDFYLNLVGEKSLLLQFFNELGVAEEVRYLPIEINERQAYRYDLDFPENYNSERGIIWREAIIDGSVEIVENIAKNKNANMSFILWRRIIAVNHVSKLRDNIKGICKYHYYSSKSFPYEPIKIKILLETAWLVDENGNFKTPAEITVDDMAKDYDVTSEDALEVIEFFNIAKNNRLTADERHDLAVMKRLKEIFSNSELEKLIADKNDSLSTLQSFDDDTEESNDSESNPQSPQKSNATNISRNNTVENDSRSPKNFDGINIDEHTDSENNSHKHQNSVEKKNHMSNELVSSQPKSKATTIDYVEPDADDLTPVAINYNQKLAQAKAKSDAEKAEIEHLEELQQKALSAEKYSFAWFKALLELEIFNSTEKNSNSKEISISFGCVEFDEGTQRTLILKYPNRYIPQFVEELENIPLVLQTANTAKTVEIEVAAVSNYTLSVKLKKTQKLDDINLNEVVEATITAKNPVFLLEKLQEQFISLGFNDNYNLRENLCENIEFVFGPPGTGKTYNLAQKIIALMSEQANKKILVLTPTNKAADVIVNKIVELNIDKSYKNWLLRFGTTNDPNIEKDGIFHDKTFDIHSKRKNVTITTIARFPYDFFITSGTGNLRDIDWNYIIIDEASMIMLIQIILPLYKKTPKKFIIAGDPFQIQPVTEIDLWKNENIYTLVGLNSFDEPKTIPHDYPVETLKTQYRSIPAIGNIFSNFAYKGILKHARTDSEQRSLNIDNWLEVQTLNIIKFPVSKYESIYRSRRLGGTSSYQIYSALFTFEFVRELSRRIDKKISIGVIAPYRAQADLIEKLFASAKLNIPTGTVHTFQGDECDILIAVFNAPPNISSSPEMFLNRLNIINVAISRARDYLFIVMPDDSTDKIENLRLIKRVENLFAKEGYGEFTAHDIENLIFGNSNYLEENSFTTGHQSVNVYGKLERKYEIRSEDNAVDVQLYEKSTNHDMNNKKT